MISTVERVLFLGGVELFVDIPSEELSGIANIAEEVELSTGQRVFAEGDPGDSMYLIVDGRVRIEVQEKTVAELGTRQCFGEMAILDNEQRSGTVTCLSDAVFLRIAQSDFLEIMMEKPELSRGIIRVLVSRLRKSNQR